MSWWRCFCLTSLAGSLWTVAEAAEFKRHDGVHRLQKAHITAHAALGRRDESMCGSSSTLCPSSLDGGCCPDGYDCAKESCYATTKGPSTCGTLVGWYGCGPEVGSGCCPDGYMCQRAGNCVPPSGSAYTYGCPTDHTLCPSSLSYGCCPSNMACAVNQCYSTASAEIVTTTMIITTSANGEQTTYKTTAVSTKSADIPTALPSVDLGDNGDQAILKYFPSAIAKVSPTSSASDDDDDGGSGLSKGALGGIIAGALAFLIIVLVTAFIIIRHLNKVVAAVSSSQQSNSTKPRPPMKEFKPTDSEVDAFSVDPLMAPRPAVPRQESASDTHFDMATPEFASNDPTPNALPAGAYASPPESATNSRHTSFDVMSPGYFDDARHLARFSQQSGATKRVSSDSRGTYAHLRHYSNASEGSDGPEGASAHLMELEATPYFPELSNSSSTVASPREEQARTGSVNLGGMTRPPMVHQRKRSDQRGRSDSLGVLSEEMHGFHGPSDHFVGTTNSHRPGTRGTAGSTVKEQDENGEGQKE